jgi:metal-responsive CopG/Arc/MetJ family transcriptional regulator
MAKVNISLPDRLLADIDALAEHKGTSRSGLVQEASTHYLADIRDQEERLARAERIGRAMEDMREIALEVGGFDGVGRIRQDRDRERPE